ncbi:hypothetical protein CR513_35854, partial [Mucuna pruriens]
VFVKYNQHLKQRYNARDESDPISLNDINQCNEWLVGEMNDDNNDAGNELVFDDDNALNWATVYEASGVGEPIMYTRLKNAKKKGITAQISKKHAVAASSKRKQIVIQEVDEDVEFENASNGEEGYTSLDEDKKDDYIRVEEDD